MCMAGRWGLVCHDNWDDSDAAVVCRQLGYSGKRYSYILLIISLCLVGGVATTGSTFGRTLGRTFGVHFVLNNVNCTGNESNIFDCQHPTDVHINCQVTRKEEAGALCGVTSGKVKKNYQ